MIQLDRLSLTEGFGGDELHLFKHRVSGIDRIELLRVAHDDHAWNAPLGRDPEEGAGLDGGGERTLDDDEHGPSERGFHLAGTLPREPSLGDTSVPSEEPLEGLRFDNCPFGSRRNVRAHWAAKTGRMRDRGDAARPSVCHAQGAIPRFDLEA